MSDAFQEGAASILLVDDTPANLHILRSCLNGQGYKILVAKDGETALKIAARAHPDLILLDILMPGLSGFDVCERLKASPETQSIAIIFLSSLDKVEDKVKGFKLGAVDFITKPYQPDEIIARVQTQITLRVLQTSIEEKNKALARELQIARRLSEDAGQQVEGALLGSSQALQDLLATLHHVAALDSNVMLMGPPGAGYEAIARRIHQLSSRQDRTFFQINGLTLLDDEAIDLLLPPLDSPYAFQSDSRFSLADGGTIFLQNIQNIPLEFQQRLFVYLQHRQKQLDGIAAHQWPDVRLLCVGDDNLQQMAMEGSFYGPLLPYIAQNRVRVPGLLERRDDILDMASFYLKQHSQRYGKLFHGLSPQTKRDLRAYSWPGNIDELSNLLMRQVALQQGPQLAIERRFFGAGPTMGGYRLLEKLGSGGMGDVWRAEHQLLAYPAAIKVIRQDVQSPRKQEIALQRFQTEARITAYLQSPHTVKMYDFGITPKGEYYYVMELLHGMDLAQLVDQFGPLPPARFVSLFRPICLSLAEAHSVGLIHRDLKPENIFICRLGLQFDFPKVLDFGVAKLLSTPPEKSVSLAQQMPVLGTPGYIAPEVMLKKDTPIDHRFDLYSLGCVAYWALTGREVFPGTTSMQRLVSHATRTPDPPSKLSPHEVPPALDALILQCLAKSPDDRMPSAYELYKQLREVELESPWTNDVARSWWKQNAPQAAKSHTEELNAFGQRDDLDAMFEPSIAHDAS